MLRSAFFILSGNAFTSLLQLVRGIVIAHLISVSDFGIASTFALSLAIVEMVSALGIPQQMIQNPNGDSPVFQNTLQSVQVVRALFNGLALFLLAEPIAFFFRMPEVTWAYRVMALVPIMNGFAHLDPHRAKRRMRYTPYLATTTLSALVSVLLVWPLSRVFGDYRLMLYVVLIQSFVALAVSHVMAERPYRWAFDRAVIRESLRFGWPVILGAIMLFAVFNGERMIVGRELGMGALAVFSMGFTLILTPTLVMEGSAQSFFLPQLSAARDDATRFAHLAMTTLQCHLLFGAAILAGTAILGGPVVHLLLGPKYAATLPILTWLALMQGVRVSKGGSSAITLARGQSENGMVASLVRAALLPVAWGVAMRGGNLFVVIWIGILGEIVGFVAALWLASWRLKLSLLPLLPMLGLMTLMLILGAVHAWGQSGGGVVGQSEAVVPLFPPLLSGAGLILCFGLAVFLARDFRIYIQRRSMITSG